LFDKDKEVRRAAWRLATNHTPVSEHNLLAEKLVSLLGMSDEDERESLSRALALIKEASEPLLEVLANSADEKVSTHAKFTLALIQNPEFGLKSSISYAVKTDALNGMPDASFDHRN
jgi:hypothetical protein